ncbi:MAG TPA: hypothetical protein VLE95_04700 [Chlamydiales bacterium]|nr:hypothetical protein [Chlamydiales bacterium]
MAAVVSSSPKFDPRIYAVLGLYGGYFSKQFTYPVEHLETVRTGSSMVVQPSAEKYSRFTAIFLDGRGTPMIKVFTLQGDQIKCERDVYKSFKAFLEFHEASVKVPSYKEVATRANPVAELVKKRDAMISNFPKERRVFR